MPYSRNTTDFFCTCFFITICNCYITWTWTIDKCITIMSNTSNTTNITCWTVYINVRCYICKFMISFTRKSNNTTNICPIICSTWNRISFYITSFIYINSNICPVCICIFTTNSSYIRKTIYFYITYYFNVCIFRCIWCSWYNKWWS